MASRGLIKCSASGSPDGGPPWGSAEQGPRPLPWVSHGLSKWLRIFSYFYLKYFLIRNPLPLPGKKTYSPTIPAPQEKTLSPILPLLRQKKWALPGRRQKTNVAKGTTEIDRKGLGLEY